MGEHRLTTTEPTQDTSANERHDFAALGLGANVLRSLRDLGFEEPTPVQAAAIPFLLQDQDVVAQAMTGTGKTAAYGIPLVQRLDPRYPVPQAIVLAPTRELAIQVSEHLSQLGRHSHLRFLTVYGGQPIERQLRALSRGVHGIVATPGRLMDHMRRGSINLDTVTTLVLDEADQMLQMGFQEDVEYIVGHLPEQRLTALFSATMPQPILDIVANYMREPEIIRLSKPQALTVPAVEQVHYVVPFPRKFDALCLVMDVRVAARTIVFCATKRMVDEVVERLTASGYSAEGLHGDVTQAGRERVLRAFRDGRTDVLVATDVAARGLDIPEVSLVINFDIPPDPEYYVHRIGRTGRVGRGGAAVTFVNPREMRELQVIERVTGARIRRAELPRVADVEAQATRQLEGRLREMLARESWQAYRGLATELALEYEPIDIAAAAIALAADHRQPAKRVVREHVQRVESPEPPPAPVVPQPRERVRVSPPDFAPRPRVQKPRAAAKGQASHQKPGFRTSRKARRLAEGTYKRKSRAAAGKA